MTRRDFCLSFDVIRTRRSVIVTVTVAGTRFIGVSCLILSRECYDTHVASRFSRHVIALRAASLPPTLPKNRHCWILEQREWSWNCLDVSITHLSVIKNNFISYVIPIIKSTLYFSNNLIFITVFHRSIVDRSSTKREEIFHKVMILLIMIFILCSLWDNIISILILLLGNYAFNFGGRHERSENSCWISCCKRSRKRDLKVCFFEGTSWLLLPRSFVSTQHGSPDTRLCFMIYGQLHYRHNDAC